MILAYFNYWCRSRRHYSFDPAAQQPHPDRNPQNIRIDLDSLIHELEAKDSERVTLDIIRYGNEVALYVQGTRVSARPTRRYGGTVVDTWRGWRATMLGRAKQLKRKIEATH